MRAAFAYLFLFALSLNAHAEQFSAMGYGLQSCAKYGEAYKQRPDEADTVYFAWALGFMSGLNLGVMSKKAAPKNLAATTQDEQRRFLRQWCDIHPTANYGDGVVELLRSLPEATGKKP